MRAIRIRVFGSLQFAATKIVAIPPPVIQVMSKTIRVFKRIPELDCFIVDDSFAKISEYLGLTEWTPVVWIGRLFTLDNDLGEHWFDNWHLRDELSEHAAKLGYDSGQLLIIDPARFQDGKDGPCHSPALRRRFWTDVLASLELSVELLAEKARELNAVRRHDDHYPEAYIQDLESRITEVLSGELGPISTDGRRDVHPKDEA